MARKQGLSRTDRKGVGRDFQRAVLRDAEKIVPNYRIVLERNDSAGFTGTSVEIPTVLAEGKTPTECYRATQDALITIVATMIESGQKPPMPSSARKRTVQANIRLTAEEKLLLSSAATSLGFKGLSDFLRRAALKEVFSLP